MIHAVLKKVFGYDSFRPSQEEIILRTIDKKDSIVIMPTGGGKSMCYQIPAIVSDGMAIVISPLIALMEDQVEGLKQNGVAAAALHSGQSSADQKDVFQKINDSQIKILYVSPERVNTQGFYQYFKNYKISFFAIDEAHCVSIWGNDFRQDYVELGQLKKNFPSVPTIALTATADEATREDIVSKLRLTESKLYISSFERKNITTASLPATNRVQYITKFIKSEGEGAGIIYCLSRKSTENLAQKLQAKGIKASSYHAGMSSHDRLTIQRRFQNDEAQVICATIAFGMGIDKPNIRWVIHYNMPKNVESYYQEIGRAGRDGLPAQAILFSNYNDYLQLKSFIDDSAANAEFKRIQHAKLDRMWEYASSYECRTNFILNYFGEYKQSRCEHCDNCSNPPAKFDGTQIAQKALSAIARTRGKAGVDLLIDVLRGSGKREIFSRGFDKIKTYGAGRDLSYLDWKSYLTQLINQGYASIDFRDHSNVKLTNFAKEVLFDKKQVNLVTFQKSTPKAKKVKATELLKNDLYEKLSTWRRELARKKGIPAFAILNNTTLEEISQTKPTFKNDLLNITGIGQSKYDQYGDELIAMIQDYMQNQDHVKKAKGTTYLETYKYVKHGLSTSEIAELRGIQETTVFSHIAHLYTKGEKINIEDFITTKKIELIKEKWLSLGSPKELTPIKEALPPEFGFGEIRLALAVFAKEMAV